MHEPTSTETPQKPVGISLDDLHDKAQSGDSAAQVALADIYTRGISVPRDLSLAAKWYLAAANAGNARAQTEYGEMLITGRGLPSNEVEGMRWLEKAAAQMYPDAFGGLGELADDREAAFKYWTQGANLNDAYSMVRLAQMYEKGEAVAANSAYASTLYSKAATLLRTNAENADPRAQRMLGMLYWEGHGVPQDKVQAFNWQLKSAIIGDPKAQAITCWSYTTGEGIEQDDVLAYAWCNLSATEGNADAPAIRTTIESKLSSTELAEAQNLASQWRPGQQITRAGAGFSEDDGGDSDSSESITGTAFFVSSTGHAITNYHVVADCGRIVLRDKGDSVRLVAQDEVSDLALLQAARTDQSHVIFSPASHKLRQGDGIAVFGYPLEQLLSSSGNLSSGTVSALTGLANNSSQFQLTAPIQPGSSGSPVLDMTGRLVGVVNMKLSDSELAMATGSIPQNVNFAVDVRTLRSFLDANRVRYQNGRSMLAFDKSLADIAEEARNWTTVVECW